MSERALDGRTESLRKGREAAAKTWNAGEEIVDCPTCEKETRQFLIEDGKCDQCRIDVIREASQPTPIGWPEVRQRRDVLLQQTDWTQLTDVQADTKDKFVDHRQELRDITDEANPVAAWNKLQQLESKKPK